MNFHGPMVTPIDGILRQTREDRRRDAGVRWMGGWQPFTPGRGLFQVQVEKDGGADGTQTTQATWTYSVRDPVSTTVLGTGMTPLKKRPAVGSVTAQTTWGIGWAFYDASDGGAFALWDANEVEGTGGCQ